MIIDFKNYNKKSVRRIGPHTTYIYIRINMFCYRGLIVFLSKILIKDN